MIETQTLNHYFQAKINSINMVKCMASSYLLLYESIYFLFFHLCLLFFSVLINKGPAVACPAARSPRTSAGQWLIANGESFLPEGYTGNGLAAIASEKRWRHRRYGDHRVPTSTGRRIGLLRERGQKLDLLGTEPASLAAHLRQSTHLTGGDALGNLKRWQRMLAPLLHIGKWAKQIGIHRRVRFGVIAVGTACPGRSGITSTGGTLQVITILGGVRFLHHDQRLLGAQVEDGRERGATHFFWLLQLLCLLCNCSKWNRYYLTIVNVHWHCYHSSQWNSHLHDLLDCFSSCSLKAKKCCWHFAVTVHRRQLSNNQIRLAKILYQLQKFATAELDFCGANFCLLWLLNCPRRRCVNSFAMLMMMVANVVWKCDLKT